MKKKRRYKRGYPVAILVGFEEDSAVLWRIFSRIVKRHSRITASTDRTSKPALYNFHESVVDALRPVLAEGVRSVLITAPPKKTYGNEFLDHLRKHHAYLLRSKGPNAAVFTELSGSATQLHEVNTLVNTLKFRNLLSKTTSEEAEHLVNMLENHLFRRTSSTNVLYELDAIENVIYQRAALETMSNSYLILTDQYLSSSTAKTRLHRLLQISQNQHVKTLIVRSDTPAGHRIKQLGGVVFFTLAS
jgi:stalled ribosome rescue protein Dom34